MAAGQIYIEKMCEAIVAAGLYDGTPEDLWNYSSTGELSLVFELHREALRKKGHKIEIELPGGSRVPC